MYRHNQVGLLLLVLLMSLSACFSRSGSTGEENQQQNAPIAASTITAVATATEAPAQPSAPQAGTTTTDPLQVHAVEEVAAINSYRLQILIDSEDARGVNHIQVDGSYIKEPPANQVLMQFQDGGQARTVETRLVNGVHYMKSGEMLVQTPDVAMDVTEFTQITPRSITELNQDFTLVGEETVSNRMTAHYQGGPQAVPTGGTEGDRFDLTGVTSAKIDLWLDQVGNFIVKMEISVEGLAHDPTARYHLSFTYHDFNSTDIVIDAPAASQAVAGQAPGNGDTDEATAEPRNALGKLLGFDLLLPTGSQITLATEKVVQVTTPYTFDEAVNLFQQVMPAHDYTLVSRADPQSGESVLLYQKGMSMITINITEHGTKWNVVATP
ncbi:MAG: hypothetical protein R3C14_06405 [Caldilineaceae bacterium]